MPGKPNEKKDHILRLAENKGRRGLTGSEISQKLNMPESSSRDFCQQLESEGRLRILAFSPLLVMEKNTLEKIEKEVLAFLRKESPPESDGVRYEKIHKYFPLPRRVSELIMERLIHSGKIRREEDVLIPVIQESKLSLEEKEMLSRLKAMCSQGVFRQRSIPEIQRKLGVSARTFDRLLEKLLETRKAVDGKEGILFDSRWLEGVITSLKESGKKTLSVSEFKNITGLSRKYAIPLLEYLDQKGVTRRQGGTRIILKDAKL